MGRKWLIQALEIPGTRRGRGGLRASVGAALFALVLGLFLPAPAQAQCETADPANQALAQLIASDIAAMNAFLDQQENYIQYEALRDRLYINVADKFLDEFSKPILIWFNYWWANQFRPQLKQMTRELHVSHVDQTRVLGTFTDAQIMIEEANRKGTAFQDMLHRYAPMEISCDMDEVFPSLSQADQLASAYNHWLAMDATPRWANASNRISAAGTGKEIEWAWKIYSGLYCDKDVGDQGCDPFPGFVKSQLPVGSSLLGRHRDIPDMLWGNKQTMDPSDPSTQWAIRDSLAYMIFPLAPDPLVPTIIGSDGVTVSGRFGMLMRRSNYAFISTIYNVMGRMLSERMGSPLESPKAENLREVAGVPTDDAAASPSYRELQEAMTKDRYSDPWYVVRLIEDPAQIAREQTTLNALRLQTLSDIYRRSEEVLFMESAAYGRDLAAPSRDRALSAIPIR